jgi:hypothetical protein
MMREAKDNILKCLDVSWQDDFKALAEKLASNEKMNFNDENVFRMLQDDDIRQDVSNIVNHITKIDHKDFKCISPEIYNKITQQAMAINDAMSNAGFWDLIEKCDNEQLCYRKNFHRLIKWFLGIMEHVAGSDMLSKRYINLLEFLDIRDPDERVKETIGEQDVGDFITVDQVHKLIDDKINSLSPQQLNRLKPTQIQQVDDLANKASNEQKTDIIQSETNLANKASNDQKEVIIQEEEDLYNKSSNVQKKQFIGEAGVMEILNAKLGL